MEITAGRLREITDNANRLVVPEAESRLIDALEYCKRKAVQGESTYKGELALNYEGNSTLMEGEDLQIFLGRVDEYLTERGFQYELSTAESEKVSVLNLYW